VVVQFVARPDRRPECGGDGYHDGHYGQDCQDKSEDESEGEGEGTAVGKGQGVESNCLGRAAPVASAGGCSALPPGALPPPSHHAAQGGGSRD
jgi:hypothetical protein